MPVNPAKTLLSLLALRGGQRIGQFVVLLLLARWLGVEEFGRYAFYLLIAQISVSLLTLGFDRLPARELPKLLSQGEERKVGGLYIFALGVPILLCLVIVSLASLLQWPGRELFVTMIFSAGLFGVIFVNRSFLSGFQVIAPAHYSETLLLPFLQFLGLGYCLLFELSLTAEIAGLCLVVAAGLSAGVSSLQVFWVLKPLSWRLDFQTIAGARKYLAGGTLIALALGLQLSNIYADSLVLGLFHSDEMVGVYRVAMSFTMISALAVSTIYGVYHPAVSQSLALGERTQGRLAIFQSLKLMLWVLSLAAILFMVFPDLITLLCGEAYERALSLMPWVAVMTLAYGFFGLVVSYLLLMRMERAVLLFQLLAVSLNVTLNFWLVPLYGLEGAAMATFFSFVPAQIGLILLVEGRSSPSGDPNFFSSARD